MKILLVDDDPRFGEAHMLLLTASGYEVDTALNRAAAKDLLDRQRALMTHSQRESTLRSTWPQLQTETNAQTKGKLLETLLDHLFRSVPGFRDVRGNVTNTIKKIDLIAAAAHDGPWLHLSPYWLIECKNWSRPVPRKDVARASRSKPPHTSAR